MSRCSRLCYNLNMTHRLLLWDIYEITTDGESVNGVMLRGRIRKLGIEKGFNVIAENTTDVSNGVRFAVLSQADGETVSRYVESVVKDCSIAKIADSVVNPILSKMKVNIVERYEL